VDNTFIFASAVSVLISGTAEEDYVEIWPPNPVVKFGGSLHLNCTSNCEDIGIESAYTKVPIGNGSNWKAFLLSNLDDWAASPLCYADCKTGQKKSPKANIIIYSKPLAGLILQPIWSLLRILGKMEVGKQYNLICRVFGVAPIRDLTVTLLKGEEQLLVKTFKDHTQLEAGVVVVNHRIRAQQNDYNKTITCQTSLDLRPAGPLLTNTSHDLKPLQLTIALFLLFCILTCSIYLKRSICSNQIENAEIERNSHSHPFHFFGTSGIQPFQVLYF
uniref:Intercellular adhesion molecule N-terminal domain-containing protein n=1 Tax=Naja naja TaxID=35670 RepID=A0A8C6YJY6_NAJNA